MNAQTLAYEFDDRTPFYMGNPDAVKKLRQGNSFIGKIFNEKTNSFLAGAAVAGSLSLATRLSVMGAVGAVGVTGLPAILLTAGSVGAVMGVYRFANDYRKERVIEKNGGLPPSYSPFSAAGGKKLLKQMMVSTGMSVVGGYAAFELMNNYGDVIVDFAQKKASVAVEWLRGTGIPDTLAQWTKEVRSTPYGDAVAKAYDWVWNKSADFVTATVPAAAASAVEYVKAADLGGKFASAVDSVRNFDWQGKFTAMGSSIENGTKSAGAWFKGLFGMTETQVAAPVIETTVPETLPEGPVQATKTARLVPENPTPVAEVKPQVSEACQKAMDEAAEAGMSVRCVNTVTIDAAAPAKATLVENVAIPETPTVTADRPLPVPEHIRAFFENPEANPLEALAKQPAFDVPFLQTEYGMIPQYDPNDIPPYVPRLADNFEIYSLPGTQDIITSSVDPADFPIGETVPAPAVPMKDQLANYFDGQDLSRRAQRLVDAAAGGDLQSQKDLAMNLLNGNGGFDKDPSMALKLYDNVIAEGRVEGQRPRGAVFQAIQDRAWMQFHGRGMDANPEAAKAALGELAQFNSGARAMLAEWNGERVQRVASAVRDTAGAARAAVTPEASIGSVKALFGGKVSCEQIRVPGASDVWNCTGPRELVEKLASSKITLDMK